jgi:hypothetical protein
MMTAGLPPSGRSREVPNERVGSPGLAEHHAVAPERVPTRQSSIRRSSSNPLLITSLMTILVGTPNWPRLKKKGGGNSMTASIPPGRNERSKLPLMSEGSVRW